MAVFKELFLLAIVIMITTMEANPLSKWNNYKKTGSKLRDAPDCNLLSHNTQCNVKYYSCVADSEDLADIFYCLEKERNCKSSIICKKP